MLWLIPGSAHRTTALKICSDKPRLLVVVEAPCEKSRIMVQSSSRPQTRQSHDIMSGHGDGRRQSWSWSSTWSRSEATHAWSTLAATYRNAKPRNRISNVQIVHDVPPTVLVVVRNWKSSKDRCFYEGRQGEIATSPLKVLTRHLEPSANTSFACCKSRSIWAESPRWLRSDSGGTGIQRIPKLTIVRLEPALLSTVLVLSGWAGA